MMADQTSKGIPVPVSKPFRVLPTPFPTHIESTKYTEVEGYKLPSFLCWVLRPSETTLL